MDVNDVEKQSISITLIDGNQQQEKGELHSRFHRFKKWCAGKYLISIGIPILIIIVVIILILLFREKNRRCGIFYSPHEC